MHAALKEAESACQNAATKSKALENSGALLACSKTLIESREQRWLALKRQLHALQERQEVYLIASHSQHIKQVNALSTRTLGD